MATSIGRDDKDNFGFFAFIITIVFTLAVVAGVFLELEKEPFAKRGICTDKYTENGTYFVKIDNKLFEVEEFYYDALIIGEGYSATGYKGKIDEVQKYTEDSGM